MDSARTLAEQDKLQNVFLFHLFSVALSPSAHSPLRLWPGSFLSLGYFP
jgi:hypothetical protein